jgi:hypothetical protein
MADLDMDRELDRVLREAGAHWRTEQVFEQVTIVPSDAQRRTGGFSGVVSGTLAIGVMVVVAAVILGPLRPAHVDGTSSAAPVVQPSLLPTLASPAEVEDTQFAVIATVNSDPENFGGIIAEDDGTLVVQYVGTNAGRAAVERVLTPAVTVRWVKVDRSAARLMTIVHEIFDRDLEGVLGIGLDTPRNQVEVRLWAGSPSIDDVSEQLTADYGEAVRVVVTPDIPMAD